MSLVQITVTKKNTEPLAKTYLLNTAKIVDFSSNSGDTVVTFFYKDIEGGRDKTDKYTTTSSKSAFETLIAEAIYTARIDLPILKIFTPTEFTVTKVINLAAADVAKAWDITTTTSKLEFNRSNFEIITVVVDATIAEIESASSTSVSIAI